MHCVLKENKEFFENHTKIDFVINLLSSINPGLFKKHIEELVIKLYEEFY